VQVQAAEIHVDGADDGVRLVGQADLRVDEAGAVLEDAHARLGQHLVVRARDRVDVPLVRDPRRDDAHVDAGLGGDAEGGGHLLVEDEVGRHDPDRVARGLDELLKDRRADILIVERAVRERLQIAVTARQLDGIKRPEGVDRLLEPRDIVPHGQEHDRHRPRGLAAHENAAVLPVAVGRGDVDVFVGQGDAAREGGSAVDDHELAVIPVVEPRGQDRNIGIENMGLDADGAELFAVVARQARDAAEVVVQNAHVEAGRRLAPQHVEDGRPHLALVDDEKLEEDVVLGLLQLLEHALEARLSAGIVGGFGVVVNGEAGALQKIARVVVGRPGLLLQLGEHGLVLMEIAHGDGVDFFHLAVFMAGGLVAAEEQIDGQPRDGEGQDQHDPRDLVRGVVPVRDDHDDGDPGKSGERDVDPLPVVPQPQHPGQQETDLQQKGQRHDHDALKQQLRQIPHDSSPFLYQKMFDWTIIIISANALPRKPGHRNFCLKITIETARAI